MFLLTILPFRYFFEITQKSTVIVEISSRDNLNVIRELRNHDLLKTLQGHIFFEYSTSAKTPFQQTGNFLNKWILNIVLNKKSRKIINNKLNTNSPSVYQSSRVAPRLKQQNEAV